MDNNKIYVISQPCVIYTLRKHPRIDNVSDSYLWHYRLGHINENRMNRLIWKKFFQDNDCESLPTCESYLLGKMTKPSFIEKDERASDVLGLDILMYVDSWVQVSEESTTILLRSQMTYLDIYTSTWWNISSNCLKCSNGSVMR